MMQMKNVSFFTLVAVAAFHFLQNSLDAQYPYSEPSIRPKQYKCINVTFRSQPMYLAPKLFGVQFGKREPAT